MSLNASSIIDNFSQWYKRVLVDPKFFCETCLWIILKDGKRIPFKLNDTQNRIIEEFTRELKEYGNVRLVILKARQQGVTTLCNALMLWAAVTRMNQKLLLVDRTATDLTDTLFKGFLEMMGNMQAPFECQGLTKTEASITFRQSGGVVVNSIRGVSAQKQGSVRGTRYNAIHLTEVDWYEHWEDFWAGADGALSDVGRSILLIESTSLGRGNLFSLYKKRDTLKNFTFMFNPWYLTTEYCDESDEPLQLPLDLKAKQEKHNLTDGQMRWYVNEIAKHGDMHTMHEYPTDIEDCFFASNSIGLYDLVKVDQACANTPFDDNDCCVCVGIDPALCKDKTAMVWRRGRDIIYMTQFKISHTQTLVYTIVNELSKAAEYGAYNGIDHVYVDIGGMGKPVYDLLCGERMLGGIPIQPVNFAETATDKDFFANKKAELYFRSAKWMRNGSHIINNAYTKKFVEQLSLINVEPNKPKFQIEDKSVLPESPDLVDAFVMTFPYMNDIRTGTHIRGDFVKLPAN